MNKPTNIALLVLAAAIAVGAQHYFGSAQRGVIAADSVTPGSNLLEGRVLSVDAPAPDKSGPLAHRYARVKLGSGETVRAIVGGCIIFPGQITRLARKGEGSNSVYLVAENGRNDS